MGGLGASLQKEVIMKILFYASLVLLLFYFLIVLPAYLLVYGIENNFEVIKERCLLSGGTVVEFPQGKFERCIPR